MKDFSWYSKIFRKVIKEVDVLNNNKGARNIKVSNIKFKIVMSYIGKFVVKSSKAPFCGIFSRTAMC